MLQISTTLKHFLDTLDDGVSVTIFDIRGGILMGGEAGFLKDERRKYFRCIEMLSSEIERITIKTNYTVYHTSTEYWVTLKTDFLPQAQKKAIRPDYQNKPVPQLQIACAPMLLEDMF